MQSIGMNGFTGSFLHPAKDFPILAVTILGKSRAWHHPLVQKTIVVEARWLVTGTQTIVINGHFKISSIVFKHVL